MLFNTAYDTEKMVGLDDKMEDVVDNDDNSDSSGSIGNTDVD